MKTSFELGGKYNIVVRSGPNKDAEMTSNPEVAAEGNNELKCALDGFEAMILACSCSGVDIGSASFREAAQSAFDAIVSHYEE
jgi:hypothetical protein